jgi:hypothetical protein
MIRFAFFLILFLNLSPSLTFAQKADAVEINWSFNRNGEITIKYRMNNTSTSKYYLIDFEWLLGSSGRIVPTDISVRGANNLDLVCGGNSSMREIVWKIDEDDEFPEFDIPSTSKPEITITEANFDTRTGIKINKIEIKVTRLRERRQQRIGRGGATQRIDRKIERMRDRKKELFDGMRN